MKIFAIALLIAFSRGDSCVNDDAGLKAWQLGKNWIKPDQEVHCEDYPVAVCTYGGDVGPAFRKHCCALCGGKSVNCGKGFTVHECAECKANVFYCNGDCEWVALEDGWNGERNGECKPKGSVVCSQNCAAAFDTCMGYMQSTGSQMNAFNDCRDMLDQGQGSVGKACTPHCENTRSMAKHKYSTSTSAEEVFMTDGSFSKAGFAVDCFAAIGLLAAFYGAGMHFCRKPAAQI